MSTSDTMMPLVSAPWLDTAGRPLPVAPVPGLRAEVVDGLKHSFSGTLSADLQALLGICCGLTGTELGSIDFTGCLFPDEPLAVFHPCITLAIDDLGRRWIAETCHESGLCGPVWCVLPDPQVAVYVSDDLAAFIASLRDCAVHGTTLQWVQGLVAQAKAVWVHRRRLAVRSYEACRADKAIRQWLATLPFDAYVYDLRHQAPARGWPYGLAGAQSRLYRCRRLPVFAVCGWPAGSRWAEDPAEVLPNPPLPRLAGMELPFAPPEVHVHRPSKADDGVFRRSSARELCKPISQRFSRIGDAAFPSLRLCA